MPGSESASRSRVREPCGRLAWQTRPPALALTARTPPGVIPRTTNNHPGSQLISAPLSNPRRRARTACGRVCRLAPVHARSYGSRPRPRDALTTRVRQRPSGAKREAGRRLAERAVEAGPTGSHEKRRVARFRGGLVDTAGLVALPRTPLLSCADAATALTAAAASERRVEATFFRPWPTTARAARCLAAVPLVRRGRRVSGAHGT
jgi:hypothetical protein